MASYRLYPGAGAVLGSSVVTGQRSNRFVGTLALRSAISARLTNELRAGLNGGTVLFFDAINDGMFSPWKGYRPTSVNYVPYLYHQRSATPQRAL
jgi:hypothetical protein